MVSLKRHERKPMPIHYKTMKELKEKTPEVLRTARRADVIITLHGKPTAVLHRFNGAEVEATLFAESPRVKKLLKIALDDVRAGRMVPVESVLARLGSDPGTRSAQAKKHGEDAPALKAST
jgi:hypothetical protein